MLSCNSCTGTEKTPPVVRGQVTIGLVVVVHLVLLLLVVVVV